MSHNSKTLPRFVIKQKGEESIRFALELTAVPDSVIVRFTGGCGLMSDADALGLCELFVDAFYGFRGAILHGGTRMVRKADYRIVVPGITEIAPLIQRANPECKVLGVAPRTEELRIDPTLGPIVSSEGDNDYITIVHPHQEKLLLVQRGVDVPATWDDEWQECFNIVEALRTYAERRSLLVCYNGGGVTERELLAWAAKGWPVLLIKGSGRTTDKYAANTDFLLTNPHVRVVDKDAAQFRAVLQELSVVPANSKEEKIIESGRRDTGRNSISFQELVHLGARSSSLN